MHMIHGYGRDYKSILLTSTSSTIFSINLSFFGNLANSSDSTPMIAITIELNISFPFPIFGMSFSLLALTHTWARVYITCFCKIRIIILSSEGIIFTKILFCRPLLKIKHTHLEVHPHHKAGP